MVLLVRALYYNTPSNIRCICFLASFGTYLIASYAIVMQQHASNTLSIRASNAKMPPGLTMFFVTEHQRTFRQYSSMLAAAKLFILMTSCIN